VIAGVIIHLARGSAAEAPEKTAPTFEALARSALAVVTGTVRRVTDIELPNGFIAREVTIDVEQTFAGSLRGRTVTLVEHGGRVGSRIQFTTGAPAFTAGERVLVPLGSRRDGSLFTLGGVHGKRALSETGERGPWSRSLRDVLNQAERRPSVEFRPQGLGEGECINQFGPGGSLCARFFEVDEGESIPFYFDPGGWMFFGEDGARQVLARALSVWAQMPSSRLRVALLGEKPLSTPLAIDDFTVSEAYLGFDLDDADIRCRDGAGDTTVIADGDESKVFGGRRYLRILRTGARVVFNPRDTAAGCPEVHICNFAEVATHEAGHAVGLNHLDNPAAMGFLHEPCACGTATTVDIAEMERRYPLNIPPTIVTPKILPPVIAGQAYSIRLEAIGGVGSFSWSLTTPYGPDTSPGPLPYGLTLSDDGVITGIATGAYHNRPIITATDSTNQSHTKKFLIDVQSSTTPTTTSTSTTKPTQIPLDSPFFACSTTTTSTLGRCGNPETACPYVGCRAGLDLGVDLLRRVPRRESRLRRLIRAIDHSAARGSFLVNELFRPERGVVLLDRAVRLVRRLQRLLEHRPTARRLGTELPAELSYVAGTLADRIPICRAQYMSP
jgi:hypothetical protein